MKSSSTTIWATGLLLLASVLCIGLRETLDARQAEKESSSRVNHDHAGVSLAGERRPAGRTGEADHHSAATLEKQLLSITRIANPAERRHRLLDLMDGFGPGDWPVALAGLRSLGVSPNDLGFRTMLEGWAEADPGAAMFWSRDVFGTGKDPQLARVADEVIFSAWLLKDRQSAIDYLLGPAGEIGRREALATGVVRSFGADLTGLARFLNEMPEGIRPSVIEKTGGDFPAIAPELRRDWIASLSPDLQKSVLPQILKTIADPGGQLALLQEYLTALGPEYRSGIYTRWVKNDAAAALASLAELPPGPGHAAAVAGTGIGLANAGRFSEAAALGRTWPDEVSDSFYSEILQQVPAKDREAAVNVATGMKDEANRSRELSSQLMYWNMEDPAAAKAWMKTHEVPEPLRRKLADQ